MHKDWRLLHRRIPFNQLNTWRHFKVEMVRLLRADLYRLVSREVGARALKRPVPDNADRILLAQNLDEARLALARFREAHSAVWSERDDYWLVI